MSENLYLARNAACVVPVGGSVVFDGVLFDSGGIAYDVRTGEIAFSAVGIYRVNWWANTQTVGNSASPVLALVFTGGGSYIGDSPLQKGVLTGMGIFNVTAPPATLTLANLSGGNLCLTASVPVKAMLSVNLDGGRRKRNVA